MSTLNLNKSNSTNYQLIFPLLPTEIFYEKSKDFSLNVFGTIIPSISLNVQEQSWQGNKGFTDDGDITFGQWTVEFSVDSKFNNWKVLYKWMMMIHNNSNSPGFVGQKEKTIDASLYIMNNWRQKAMMLRFKNIWPSELGDVTFSKREGMEDLYSQITFSYDKYDLYEDIV